MFTGLIRAVGQIESVAASENGGTLSVRCEQATNWGEIGASIAVNGVCLTVRELRGDVMLFDVLAETLNRTNLKRKAHGSLVNLEPALRLGDPVGGHWVTGHVDGVGTVQQIRKVGRDREVRVACDPSLAAQMVVKGSISCDGISLTLVTVQDDSFSVHIIPHTWEHTAWRTLSEGDSINIELDLLGRYVFNYLQQMAMAHGIRGKGVTWERLRDAGFGV